MSRTLILPKINLGSIYNYEIPDQSAVEIATQSERLFVKTISDKILIKDKSPREAPALRNLFDKSKQMK